MDQLNLWNAAFEKFYLVYSWVHFNVILHEGTDANSSII